MRIACGFLATSLAASGCIIPFATPPFKSEIGGGTRVAGTEEQRASSLHVAAGTHLASATTRRSQWFDLGVGYVFDMTRGDPSDRSHGLYLDTSVFIDRASRSRTSLGARTELHWLGEGHAFAAKLRIDTELFKTGSGDFDGHGRCSTTAGTYHGAHAIGLFVEAGRIWEPETMTGGDGWLATAGVTVRLPTTVGILFGIPGCK